MMNKAMRPSPCVRSMGNTMATPTFSSHSGIGRRSATRTRTRSLAEPTQATITEDDRTKLEFLQERFSMFDMDENGQIDREELRQLLESVESGTTTLLAQHWLPEQELDRVMEMYDKDKNGTIDFEEFTSIVYDGLLLDGKLSEYEEAFNAVDKTGNGTIGGTELTQLFKDLGQELSFEKLASIMEKYDKDESGQIEFNEFLMMFRDQLLDLQAIESYIVSGKSSEAARSQAILDTAEGEISVVFSEQEMEEVMQRKDGKLLVVFTALTWCRPCKSMQRPAIRLAQHYKDTYTFVKLFGNSNEQTKRLFKDKLQVRSTPCFMIMNGDKCLHTQLGANKERLEDALRYFVPEGKMPKGRLYFPQT